MVDINPQQSFEILNVRKSQLEAVRRDIVNKKFMGGLFGLIIFLFFSMGIGIIMWMWALFSDRNQLAQIDAELAIINNQINTLASQAILQSA